MRVLGYSMVFAALAGTAFAGVPVPEIDPGTVTSAVALLLGGYLVAVSRLPK